MSAKDQLRATDDLRWYLRKIFLTVGLEWTTDNDSEVESIVENIVEAAAAKARGKS